MLILQIYNGNLQIINIPHHIIISIKFFDKNYNWHICFIQKKYAYCNRYFSDMTYTVKLVYGTDISININQSIIKRFTNTIR